MSSIAKISSFIFPFTKSTPLTDKWLEIGKIPGYSNFRYTPQGLTFDDQNLILSECWNNKSNRIYKINLNVDPYDIIDYFDMTEEFKHVSGLSFDKDDGNIWASDYYSNCILLIDTKKSFKLKKSVIIKKLQLPLKGLSACSLVNFKSSKLLAFSTFLNCSTTYFIDCNEIFNPYNFHDKVILKYNNFNFSQGLASNEDFLYESNNNIGKNMIYKISLKSLFDKMDLKDSVVSTFKFIGYFIEDLEIKDNYLYSADELSYKIYKMEL